MNREQAKGVVKHFEIVKAFAEGKAIQFLNPDNGLWEDGEKNLAFLQAFEYRIKPEPRKIRVWLTACGTVMATRYSWADALPEPEHFWTNGTKLVEFVEVLPEDKS